MTYVNNNPSHTVFCGTVNRAGFVRGIWQDGSAARHRLFTERSPLDRTVNR